MDDINIRYLRQHYNNTGTINDISTIKEVEFEGQILKIGSFLGTMRNRYKVHREGKGKPSELALWRYKQLNEMHFEWTPRTTTSNSVKSKDPYIKYLRRHYNLYGTINDITREMVVEFEGKTLRIGSFITATRIRHRHYLNNDNTPGCASKTALERYRILEQMKIEWEPQEKINEEKLQTTDRHIRYLRKHYEEHGTINNISVRTVVMFENELLKIGNFLADIRAAHRAFIADKENDHNAFNERSLSRYKALDEMNFDWNPSTRKASTLDYELYIRYLQQFYMEHGSLENVTLQDLVEFEGKVLRIRYFISNIKAKHSDYEKGINKKGSFSSKSIKVYKILDEMNFNWDEKKNDITHIATENNISQSELQDYLNKFNGNLEKAVIFCLRNKKFREENDSLKFSKYSIVLILKEFDINIETLIHYLSRDCLIVGEKKSNITYDESMTLIDFCTSNNYNYDIIGKAIKLKINGLCDEPLESLINRCIIDYKTHGQIKTSTWIYGKYGNEPLIRHMLSSIGVDSKNVLTDMSWHAIDIEEALQRECFRKTSADNYDYMQGIFYDYISFYKIISDEDNYNEDDVIEKMTNYRQELAAQYQLTEEEIDIIENAFDRYISVTYQYHLYEVAFEKDPEKKVEKIIKYKFDDDDIEESFFMPLKFEQKVLIGRDSELYKRRTIIKNLTVDWNNKSEEEQERLSINYSLTQEELQYIGRTRQEIDTVKAKVKAKK